MTTNEDNDMHLMEHGKKQVQDDYAMHGSIVRMTNEQFELCKADITYFAENWYFRQGRLHSLMTWQRQVLRMLQSGHDYILANVPIACGKKYANEVSEAWQKFCTANRPYRFLNLVLTRRWFNEIKYGEKNEEYRLATDFYRRRFIESGSYNKFKDYTHIVLHNAYTDEILVYPIVSIRIGSDVNPDWCPIVGPDYYITKFDKS